MLGLAAATVIVSIFLTLMISRTFFVPIERLIGALQKVASGDFNVCLPEQSETPEVTEMNVNFNKMVSELNSMEILQSDFIQNVSHEIKTPLSAIEGYATLLNSAPLNGELHEYANRNMEGNGLGLALVKRIVELCAGSVTVDSCPGGGSAFTVSLPYSS